MGGGPFRGGQSRPRPGPRDRARRASPGRAGKGRDGMEKERKAKEGAGGDDLPVPGLLAGASVRNSISIFYEK